MKHKVKFFMGSELVAELCTFSRTEEAAKRVGEDWSVVYDRWEWSEKASSAPSLSGSGGC